MLALLGLVVTIVLVVGLRWVIHRSLAPERIVETQAPADVGSPHRDVSILTENGKTLFGWFIPTNREGRGPAVVLLHGWGGNAETLLPLVAGTEFP